MHEWEKDKGRGRGESHSPLRGEPAMRLDSTTLRSKPKPNQTQPSEPPRLPCLGFLICCWLSTADTILWLLSVTTKKRVQNQWNWNWWLCLYIVLLTFRWFYSLSVSCFSFRDGAFSVSSVWPSDFIPARRKEMPRMFKVSMRAATGSLMVQFASAHSRLSIEGQRPLCCWRSLEVEISEVLGDHVPLPTSNLPQ